MKKKSFISRYFSSLNFFYFAIIAISALLAGCEDNSFFANQKQIAPIAPPPMPSAQNPSQINFSTTFPLEDEPLPSTQETPILPPPLPHHHHPIKCKHFVGGYRCIGITNNKEKKRVLSKTSSAN